MSEYQKEYLLSDCPHQNLDGAPPPTQSQFNLTGTLKMCSLLLKEADYLI